MKFDFEVWDLDSGNMIYYSNSCTEALRHMLEWGSWEHKESLRLHVNTADGKQMELMFDPDFKPD
jgi:hypothetical protein